MTLVKGKPSVFAVPKDETATNLHEVVFAADGDLNKAARRGNIKRFRKWNQAVEFAHEKGREMGAEVLIHAYGRTPNKTYRYERLPSQSPKIKSRRLPRITPKMPRLR